MNKEIIEIKLEPITVRGTHLKLFQHLSQHYGTGQYLGHDQHICSGI
ncbi:MAG: hypothetical protein ACI8ZM_000508 [Crocinitomix sp.]|jgi:hypothetical protein